MRLRALAALGLLMTLAGPLRAQAQTFSFQELGSLVPNGSSTAAAINNAGQVTGVAQGSNGQNGAFLWTGGSMKQLLPPKTFSTASGVGINSHGDVVGWGTKSNTPSGDQSLMWIGGGAAQTVVVVPGGYTSRAYGINDARQIAGAMVVQGDGMHAFLSTVEGGKRKTYDLGYGFGVAINKTGQVLIWDDRDLSVSLWTPTTPNGNSGQRLRLGVGGYGSQSGGLNDSGQAVFGGYIWLPRPAWGLPAGLNSLGALKPLTSAYDHVRAVGINNRGQVVGYQSTVLTYDNNGFPSSSERTPFIWDAAGGMRELVADSGASAGWGGLAGFGNLVPVMAINDPAPGQTWGQVVYTRFNESGVRRGVLLQPVTP